MLLVALWFAGALAACGNSSSTSSVAKRASPSTSGSTTASPDPTTSAPAREAPAATKALSQEVANQQRQHTALVAFVACMRRHGYPVHEPDSHNHLSTRGFNMQSPRLKAVGTACYEKTLTTKKPQTGPVAPTAP